MSKINKQSNSYRVHSTSTWTSIPVRAVRYVIVLRVPQCRSRLHLNSVELIHWTFTASDSAGRLAKSAYKSLYVSGGTATAEQKSAQVKFVNVETVRVQLDKKGDYNVGDTCEVCCVLPFSPAVGLLQCFVHGTAVHTQQFKVADGVDSAVLSMTVAAEWIPSFVIAVEVVGQTARDGSVTTSSSAPPMRPAIAHGTVTVPVSLLQQRLDVDVTPLQTSDIARPGAHISTSVVVTRAADHQPVSNVPVTLIMVDESVLSLSAYELDDPLPLFYPNHPTSINFLHTRAQCWLMNVEDAEALKESMMDKERKTAEQLDMLEDVEQELQLQSSFVSTRSKKMAVRGAPRMLAMSRMASPMMSGAPPPPPAALMALVGAPPGGRSQKYGAARKSSESSECEGGGGGDGAMSAEPIAVRSNFDPLAAFISHTVTDHAGRVEHRILLPDNITKYRVWAIAAAQETYGKGQSHVTVSLPVMIRPSLPRFVNFGDVAHITVVVQNQTETVMNVLVGMRTQNIRLLQETPNVYRITLQPLQRLPVVWQVIADRSCGTARFHFAISTVDCQIDYSDAAEETIPIFTPCTTEAFAVYGDVSGDNDNNKKEPSTSTVIQPIVRPRDCISAFGGIDVSCSTTILQSLTDAVIYLTSYPYDCNEQIASRLLAITALYDVLLAFNSPQLPTPTELTNRLSSDLTQLAQRQHTNGGWAFWGRYDSWSAEPFLTVHVTHALVISQQRALVTVNGSMISSALAFCRNITSHFHHWQSKKSRAAVAAYAYYVVTKAGENVADKARQLIKENGLDDLSLESLAWILVAVHGPVKSDRGKSTSKSISDEENKIRAPIFSRVVETAETVSFVTNYGDDGASVMLHSDRRTDAVILDAILITDPTNNIAPKIAKSLLAHRTAGRWASTQENSWCLVALERYFKTFEAVEPMLSAAIWLGDQYCGTQTFKGRSVNTQRVAIPMSTILDQTHDTTDADNAIIIQRTGNGRLYYRIGLSYAPSSLRVSALNKGFTVERSYAAVSKKDRCESSGTGVNREWHIGIDSLIRVTIKFTSRHRRYHVALCDYIPAGCEPVNSALLGSVTAPQDEENSPNSDTARSSRRTSYSPWQYRWQWYDHTNTRDERVEAFTSALSSGSYEYTFLMTATSRGRFVVPPTKMEEMYSPEIFGRSNTEIVHIE